jgi:hypothetical protein
MMQRRGQLMSPRAWFVAEQVVEMPLVQVV